MQMLREMLDHAQQAAQDCARALQRAQSEQTQAEAKLRNLQEFAEQYRLQLAEQQSRGGEWSRVRDLRGFLDRVAAAQAAQRVEVERAIARCGEHMRAWTSARQKHKAYEVLLAQEEGLALAQRRKVQQAELQDWSLNRRPGFADSAPDSQNSRFDDSQNPRSGANPDSR